MIIAVDRYETRLDQAREFGATHCVSAVGGETVAAIRALTGGRGVDYADAAGQKSLWSKLMKVSLCGVAMAVGIPPNNAEIKISASALVYEERAVTGSLYGSAAPRRDIPQLINLYRDGDLKLDELLTRIYPIEEINEAYAAMESGDTLRSVIKY